MGVQKQGKESGKKEKPVNLRGYYQSFCMDVRALTPLGLPERHPEAPNNCPPEGWEDRAYLPRQFGVFPVALSTPTRPGCVCLQVRRAPAVVEKSWGHRVKRGSQARGESELLQNHPPPVQSKLEADEGYATGHQKVSALERSLKCICNYGSQQLRLPLLS